MSKKIVLLAFCLTALLSACSAPIPASNFIKSSELCSNNGGLKALIVDTLADSSKELRGCVCVNGAKFTDEDILGR